MANDKKKQVEQITDMEVDFAQWYTDVCKKAELIDYSSIKGMFIYRPYGYAIWENIQREMDRRFKETGHENVYLPMLIPESLLQKEKDHVEGFAPECAWVTYGGSEKLEERYCIRPTSETLFCEHYKNIIHSHRDLPKLYNQWCSVLRWEKTSRPFLRHREFLWQEGHTMHATEEEAREETMRMLNLYADFMENVLAMPVVRGRKTDKEKFNGAEETYTVECMMHDRKALQAGTSHYFGDGFARAFDITFTGRDNQLHYPHQTSWGVSTRMIGGIIMTHGDNNGLVLPPRIAPIQAIVIPVAQHKEGVIAAVKEGNANRYDLLPTIQRYIRYLTAKANGREPSKKDSEIEGRRLEAEADLKRSKADIAALQLSELEGTMHRSEDVEAVMTDLVYNIRSMLVALPGRLAVDVTGAATPAEASEIIRTEVYKILTELAGYKYDPEVYARRVRDREGWSEQLADDADD